MDETEPLMVGGQDDTANSTPLYEHRMCCKHLQMWLGWREISLDYLPPTE